MSKENLKRPSKNLIESFRKLATPTISDALDKLGIKGGCEGILPIIQGSKIVGPAFTLKYIPVGVKKGTVGDYIDLAQPGDIFVLDNGGRTYCTVWGGILSITAKLKGIAGTIIDGVCRDVEEIYEQKYPIFSRGRFMVTGKDRVQLEAMNIPICIANIQVKPMDIVVADDSGVLIIPQEKAEEVLGLSQNIAEKETQIEKAVKEGLSLQEARKKYGYHCLQRRKD